MSARRRPVIPFTADPASRLTPWLIGFMTFVAALALAGALALAAFSDAWSRGLADSMTVQVPPPADMATAPGEADDADAGRRLDETVAEVVRILRDTDGVTAVEPLPGTRVRELLQPWLGASIDPADLPLPRLIAVQVAGPGAVDMARLRGRLETVASGVAVDDHGMWRARLARFLGALQLVGLAVVAIVVAAAATVVVFATRGSLLAHWDTIELLHLIGASDGYVARQFQNQAMRAALKGGGLGTLLAAGTVVALGEAARAAGAEPPAPLVLPAWDWVYLAALPLATALIALIAARRTVLRSLRRMP